MAKLTPFDGRLLDCYILAEAETRNRYLATKYRFLQDSEKNYYVYQESVSGENVAQKRLSRISMTSPGEIASFLSDKDQFTYCRDYRDSFDVATGSYQYDPLYSMARIFTVDFAQVNSYPKSPENAKIKEMYDKAHDTVAMYDTFAKADPHMVKTPYDVVVFVPDSMVREPRPDPSRSTGVTDYRITVPFVRDDGKVDYNFVFIPPAQVTKDADSNRYRVQINKDYTMTVSVNRAKAYAAGEFPKQVTGSELKKNFNIFYERYQKRVRSAASIAPENGAETNKMCQEKG